MKEFPEFDWVDLGTHDENSTDYPDYGHALGKHISQGLTSWGVVVCGSGIGISIAANRYAQVRAALCTSEEMAKLSRLHNNANVLALGERIVDFDTACKCVKAFFATEFEGGRHEARVQKLGEVA